MGEVTAVSWSMERGVFGQWFVRLPPGATGAVVPKFLLLDMVDAMNRSERLQKERRWIPVQERLPPEDKSVLVLTQYSEKVYRSAWGNAVASYRDGEWREDEESNIVSVVTHWMPIPPDPPGVTGMIAEPADCTEAGEK